MRKILILTYFLITVFILNSKSQDFWELINIPDSINPSKLDFNSFGDVFMGSSNGVYKSEDEGETWIHCGNLTKATYNIVVSSDDYIYAGASNSLYRSTDDGFTWQFIDSGLVIISLNITSNDILFCGNWGGLYKSADSGYTWTQVFSTVNTEVFNNIIEKDSFLFAGSMHFISSTGGGVYRSSDNGDTWEHVSMAGHGVSSFALDINGNLLAGTQLNYFGVYRSENNGIIWQKILSGHVVTSLAVDEFGGIYAGCNSDFGPSGVKYSENNGLTWSSLNSGFHTNASITSLAISPANYIYATTYSPTHLYRSINTIVGINESEIKDKKHNIHVYPNPAKDIIYIESIVENHTGKYNIYITDISGRIVKSLHSVINNKTFELDISDLNSAMYFVHLVFNNKKVTFKLMVNRNINR